MSNNRKKQTREQVTEIFRLAKSGVKQSDISIAIGCSQSTVSKILNKISTPNKTVHDCTADRYEYFLKDEARNTGNLRNRIPIYTLDDPTFEEVAFWERMDKVRP